MAIAQNWTTDALPDAGQGRTLLPYGCGRSYGDTCLNEGNAVLLTRSLDRYIAFDSKTGVLRCEAGVTLDEILTFAVPQGWFLPVTPGTKFVTVGGAIANDVHGKNHHSAGNFGHHVLRFELLRSDGSRRICSPHENGEWFRATIGGLGLTGLVTWAEFKLQPVRNSFIEQDAIRFSSLDEFFSLSRESSETCAFTVAWIDCFVGARGRFFRGNHSSREDLPKTPHRSTNFLTMPFDAPEFFLNPVTLKAANQVYYRAPNSRGGTVHYDGFFYPLDAVHHWNRVYGRRGFFQYQCVVPDTSDGAIREILRTISAENQGSFLAVLKVFGDVPAVGQMSFPRAGVTLALDFANRGEETLRFLERLDAITLEAKGCVYPAKDARMSARSFRAFFPQYTDFAAYVDPKFSSSFWRRVTNV